MVFNSPYPDIKIPDISVARFLLQRFKTYCSAPALIDATTGEQIGFDRLVERIQISANAMVSCGVRKGDVVAIMSGNDILYPIAALAVILAGAQVMPVPPLSSPEEVTRYIQMGNATRLIVADDLVASISPVAKTAGIKHITVFRNADGFQSFETLGPSNPNSEYPEILANEDIALLPFSSGTTGVPKGVQLTHKNLVANLLQTEQMDLIGPGDVSVAMAPFFHIYGLTFAIGHTLAQGAALVVIPRFTPDGFLHALQEYKVSHAPLVPPIIHFLAKDPLVDNYDLSALKVVLTGAAALDPKISNVCTKRLNVLIRQGYGMTETCSITHIDWNDQDRVRAGSIGVLAPNTQAKITDIESGHDLDTGDEGELWVRGPQVMLGYLNNPLANDLTLTDDGWLKTGDLAKVDAQGTFSIVGRLKELVKYNGYQVPPAELEEVLLTHDAVHDAAVVGRANAEVGEVPVAFVVIRGDATDDVTAADIESYVARKVAPYKRAREVVFIDAIPRSPSGKILRLELIKQLPPIALENSAGASG